MEMLTIAQASKSLNIPNKALRRLVNENRVPFIKVGNRAYLIADALEQAIREEAYAKVVKNNESDESDD